MPALIGSWCVQKVLGAKQMFPPVTMGEPPIISHVAMKIGESTIMMHDFYEAAHHDGPSSSFVYVPDVDATCQLAKEAGVPLPTACMHTN